MGVTVYNVISSYPLYPKKESAYNQALTSFPNPKHVGVQLALGPVPVAALGPVLVEPVLLGLVGPVLLEGVLEGGVLVLVVLVVLALLEVLVDG